MADLAKRFGAATHRCRRCGKTSGVIRRYDLCYCRQCFREIAKGVGFRKYS